jgi:membrane-associated phospholipid phosphatase
MQRANYLIFIAALPACTTLPNGHAWGQDATLLPGWEKVQTAAIDAARSPMTWAPLLAAGLLQIDNADENLSDWAADDTPIFGSRQTADTISTDLMRASVGLYAVTALATPSGDEHWLENKAKGLGIGFAAELTTDALTDGIKAATDRQRPNGLGHSSFPSGHASAAAVSATLASDNIDTLHISQGSRLALKGLAAAFTVGTAYARVEARQHFPSDVLAGAALGHFIGGFADGAFLGVEQRYRVLPMMDVSRSGFLVGINGHF